jgi:membrane protease YdiL (CAAX protease family)
MAAGEGGSPQVMLELAILHAAAGHREWVAETLRTWQDKPKPYSLYAKVLAGAYLVPEVEPTMESELQAELAELLPQGWFYDRLAGDLAAKGGDHSLRQTATTLMSARGQPLLERSRFLGLVEFGVLSAGLILLLRWTWRRRGESGSVLPVAAAQLPPPWTGKTGFAVLIRGGALGMIVVGGILLIGTDDPLLRMATIPASNLPVIYLARRFLFFPAGVTPGEGLGLRPIAAWWRVAGVTLIVLAIGLFGEWAIERIAVSFEKASHWTEWFDPDLVWGESWVLLAGLLEYIMLAPFFEELVFRGFLFATLRRRFKWGAAALVSATIFAAAHGYGVLGFVSVLWSGILWAWAYEKTGSLVPGMIAHALSNLMVCTTVIALLRF